MIFQPKRWENAGRFDRGSITPIGILHFGVHFGVLAPWRYRFLEKAERPYASCKFLKSFTQSFHKTGRINKLLIDIIHTLICSYCLRKFEVKAPEKDCPYHAGPNENTRECLFPNIHSQL